MRMTFYWNSSVIVASYQLFIFTVIFLYEIFSCEQTALCPPLINVALFPLLSSHNFAPCLINVSYMINLMVAPSPIKVKFGDSPQKSVNEKFNVLMPQTKCTKLLKLKPKSSKILKLSNLLHPLGRALARFHSHHSWI